MLGIFRRKKKVAPKIESQVASQEVIGSDIIIDDSSLNKDIIIEEATSNDVIIETKAVEQEQLLNDANKSEFLIA
jgi:hypothetical protein